MPSYVAPSGSASRRFVTTPYRPDKDGDLQPEWPDCCPDHVPGGEGCDLVKSHLRDRKTGPCFSLTVLHCRIHERGFTLYPLGHVPYGRQRVAPVDLEGRATGASDRPLHWRWTLFDAALDAAAGDPWDRASAGGSRWWWSAQGRLLSRCLDLVGVAPGQDLDLRHQLAEALAVDTLVLLEGVAAIGAQPGYRSRGQAVVDVLSAIPRHGLLDHVLRAGWLAGRWGPPLRWEPELGVLRPLAFSSSGTDPPR
jgi:hypothetical protein